LFKRIKCNYNNILQILCGLCRMTASYRHLWMVPVDCGMLPAESVCGLFQTLGLHMSSAVNFNPWTITCLLYPCLYNNMLSVHPLHNIKGYYGLLTVLSPYMNTFVCERILLWNVEKFWTEMYFRCLFRINVELQFDLGWFNLT
jgi:hypothetical protein